MFLKPQQNYPFAHSNPPQIALYTPDAMIRQHVAAQLAQRGLCVDPVSHPAASTPPWSAQLPDLFIVDIVTNQPPAEKFMRMVRLLVGSRPIIALTAADDMAMRVLALDHGADDAVPVHCHPLELATRIFVLLRRYSETLQILRCDDLSIDRQERHVVRGGQHIPLPAREYALLLALACTPNQPVSQESLLRALWRLDFDPGTNRVAVHMSRLRSRVDHGFAWRMLHTIKGIGYCLRTQHAAA